MSIVTYRHPVTYPTEWRHWLLHPHALFDLFGTDAQGLLFRPDLLLELAFYMVFVVVLLFTLGPDHPG